MDKKSAMAMVNEHVGCQLLTAENTSVVNVNNSKDVWWVNVDPRKFERELHVVLVKDRDSGLIWLRIAPGSISAPEDVFRLKEDGRVDFEISRDMKDVKSGGTRYDFTRHVEWDG